jgi:hypothetical protein
VAGFLARLVRGVLLGARVVEHVAQARRQRQRALLAVQDLREAEARRLVGEADLLALVELVGDGAVQLDREVARHDGLLAEVEGLAEVDVDGIERIPEVVLGRGDDLVERAGAPRVAIDLDHRVEVVAVDRVVDGVVGDVVGHGELLDGRGRLVSMREGGMETDERLDDGLARRARRIFAPPCDDTDPRREERLRRDGGMQAGIDAARVDGVAQARLDAREELVCELLADLAGFVSAAEDDLHQLALGLGERDDRRHPRAQLRDGIRRRRACAAFKSLRSAPSAANAMSRKSACLSGKCR